MINLYPKPITNNPHLICSWHCGCNLCRLFGLLSCRIGLLSRNYYLRRVYIQCLGRGWISSSSREGIKISFL